MHTILAQTYGFEGTLALTVFAVGVGALVLVALLMVRANIRLWLVGGMLFFACLSYGVKYDSGVGTVNVTWMLPIQAARSDLYLALGVLLCIFTLVGVRGLRSGDVPIQGFIFLLIGLYASVLRVMHDGPVEGLQSIGFSLATVLPVILTVPSLLRDYEDCLKLLRVIMFVSIIWAACCAVQFVINPQALLAKDQGGRFMGMTGNAQFVALQCGVWSFVALWLLLNDSKSRFRLIWLGLVGINLIFTAWTGSRMGALVVVTGSSFVLLSRIGRAVLFLPVAALVTVGLYQLSEDLSIGVNIERLVSREDTRSHVWYNQLGVAMENPFIGTGFAESGGSENSYFLGIAAYGAGMGILMLVLLIATGFMMARLYLRRKLLPPEQRPIVDLIVGFNLAFFLAAFFDGVLVSRIGGSLSHMLMFSSLALRISQLQAEAQQHRLYPEHADEADQGHDDAHRPGDLPGAAPEGA